MFTFS
jgi:hypothetical protein